VGDASAAVATRLLASLDRLLERLGSAYRAVPEYDALPPDVMASEVLPVSREIVEVFLRAVAAGREPDVREVAVLPEMGRRRLEMGVPLEPMLHVYRLAGREVFDAIAEAVRPGEEQALAELGRAWIDYIDRASSVAASGYLRASHERLRRLDAQRDALIGALLAAADPSDVAAVAAEFSVVVAPVYVPVLAAGPDIATRIDRVAGALAPGTLTGFRGGHVVALVPGETLQLDPLLAELPGATVAHGHPAAPGTSLAGEVGHTELLLRVALASGRTGRVGPEDLLVEQLLAANPRVASALQRRVTDRLRAADRTGELEATLRAYLASGSVPATGRAVFVHPNTVAYRLRRVAATTGLDPRVPAEAAVLVLALAAR
jgi:hypothetical protein